MKSISGLWKPSSLRVLAVAVALGLAGPALAQDALAGGDARVSGKHMSSPVINRVAIEGNSKVKSDMLQAEMRTKAQSAFSPQLADADVARFMEIYRRSGRAAAKVTYRTVDLPNGRIDVVFTIVEGDKTGVKEIKFVGNQVYSNFRLVSMMETTEMNFLSFIKTSDVYDPDRIAADLELVRRFYLKNGYADFHVVSSDARYDAQQQGYIITIVVEEGPQYRVSDVDIESHLPDIDAQALRGLLRVSAGDVYNGDAVEKTVEALSREIARKGYAFTQARPRGQRDAAARTVSIRFVLDEGPRVYIERIDIHGNTRTRDYVIRREFEIGEGDAYNRVLIDRAERRLNGLGYFKKVKITNEPGSSPDRVVLNVDVEDQPTGNFGISGGYSTTEGFIGEVSVSESNFMGRGQAVRLSLQEGQRARGVTFSFTEPYFLDQRVAAGFDVFAKRSDAYNYQIYSSTSVGGTLRFGVPITDEVSFAPRYSIYRTSISIPNDPKHPYNDCKVPIPGVTPGFGNPYDALYGGPNAIYNCQSNGEASLAIKESQGGLVTSQVGYSLSYNDIDNFKNPHNGISALLSQDLAGLGGDTHYIRTTGDARYYHEIPFFLDDVVGLARVQGGHIAALGGYQLRVMDNFNLGPSLVRGFAPGGIGPRDSNIFTNQGNSLGGSDYLGGSLEVQFPIWGLPKDIGLRGAVFADAGTLWNFQGRKNFLFPNMPAIPGVTCVAPYTPPQYGQGSCVTPVADSTKIRSAVGASLLWQSPMGPIRFDYAVATSKVQGDITQRFRFSGGANF